ncbi:alpha/beta fold hydrolase [Archangium lipolyticum]|uniref:alpha/beta fold hydrolase n=1 Tax=Archangium lipolyticum TaxID=2970465 RepID=UPI00214A325C|nr:alpha/beta hydrolase [Archangium lipolyticum]
MKSLVKTPAARTALEGWYQTIRSRIPAKTTERRVPTRYGETHVLVGGPEDGPPVVVLHGALASSALVLREIAPLLSTFRVHAVDIIGQSVKSAEVRPSVSDNSYGIWLAEVMEGLGLAKAHVIAVSYGGFVALRLAAHAPERIDRLVLLVPAGMVSGPPLDGFFKLGLPMLLYRAFPSEKRLERSVQHLLTTVGDDWTHYLGEAFRGIDLDMRIPPLAKPEELASLTAPTLVIGADKDLSFPGRKLLDRAAKVLPNLKDTELIENCLHCPPTTDEFRAWLSGRISRFLLDARWSQ